MHTGKQQTAYTNQHVYFKTLGWIGIINHQSKAEYAKTPSERKGSQTNLQPWCLLRNCLHSLVLLAMVMGRSIEETWSQEAQRVANVYCVGLVGIQLWHKPHQSDQSVSIWYATLGIAATIIPIPGLHQSRFESNITICCPWPTQTNKQTVLEKSFPQVMWQLSSPSLSVGSLCRTRCLQ